ncbi:MAG TPA: right-handed parallel beta-helix repeat-containing protein [Candidatus Binataceae bacterium]|nr:right-handed parallel beta-helix repeat-containing protein [Candidatus Binataceae bacterium]
MRATRFALLICTVAISILPATGQAANVKCNSGQSLATAVAVAQPESTISFSGVCKGPINVNANGLTLDGQNTGIIDGGSSNNAVIITGVHRFTLSHATIRNGISGIVVQAGGIATLSNLAVNSNSFDNILITGNSSATIADTNLRGGVNGLDVESSSSVIFTGHVVSSDALAFGIDIGTGSSVTLSGARVRVSGNALGIQVGVGASGFIDPASSLLAFNNATTGITVVSGSHLVNFGGRMETAGNKIDGFSADSKSGLDLDAASMLFAHDNGQDGVHLEETSVLNMFNTTAFSGAPGNTTLISDKNAGQGIGVHGNSEFHMNNQVKLVSQSNNGGGALADNGSALIMINSNLIQNTGFDVELTFGSRGDLSSSHIGVITCDATALIRGDAAATCPSR